LSPAVLLRPALLALVLALAGCAGTKPYATGPVKTFDPDDRSIPEPESVRGNEFWDPIDRTFFYQVEKPLNLNWTLRRLGQALRLVGPKEAENVNTLDEVPESSWFTQRHFYFPMTREELQRGPDVTDGPDPSGPWTIIEGKNEGKTKGFTIEDPTGQRYVMKFDGPDFPELTSSAEVIATKVYYAAGYHVPQNTVVYFDPALLVLGPDAEVEVEGRERPMTEQDLAEIVGPQPRRADGTIRAMASRYVDGLPVGPWSFRGTRPDDPNDRVHHEHRRELRGLSVLGSWLNDADRRDANTLAVYTTDVRAPGDTARYVRHYLLDMGSTLGANAAGSHQVRHGQEYMFDPRTIAAQFVTLGLRTKPYEFQPLVAFYPSVGYFTAMYFEPKDWVMVHPNPAYEHRTDRDGFWGAKRVMAFSEADVRALVETGRLTDPDAEEYLVQTLLARRDEIGRYWFGRVNPLDRFAVTDVTPTASLTGGAAALRLTFDDLAVEGGLEHAEASRYAYRVTHGRTELASGTAADPALSLPPLPDAARASSDADDHILRVEIRTLRDGQEPSPRTDVYLHLPPGGEPRVVGIDRK